MTFNQVAVDFIIANAVDRFNFQYGKDFKYSDFRIFSVNPEENCDRGYELYTSLPFDNVRLRVYLIFGSDVHINYRLETDTSFSYNELGDEVFTTLFGVDKNLQDGIGYFPWIDYADVVPVGTLSTEDYIPLLTESGMFLTIEG